jgi:DNA-binding HTH domain-containing proteins
MKSDENFADSLYEAALVPELWTQTCEKLAAEAQADCASIFTVDTYGNHRFVTTPNVAEAYARFAASPHAQNNTRALRALERSPFVFARDIDVLTEKEFREDQLAPLFLHPNGIEWEAGCVFQEPSGHMIAIILMHAKGRGHFTDEQLAKLNLLKPDLARAAYMASQLGFREARSMADALSMVGVPAAVIGDTGRSIAMNNQMEALSPRIRTGAGDKIVLEAPGASALLDDAIRRYKAQAVPTVQSLPIASRDGEPALILHLLPVRRAARDIFSRSMAILAVTNVGEVGPPDMRVLCGLFDLTPAEARVARGIALAQTPETVAANLGISIQTARSHLKRIMQKTGTTRQAELVLLLSGLSVPGDGGKNP